ncbi:porin, partial [Salmonella enterica subsp. enterica serovar Kentucky]|nr:porin [Salmonella enterica subsp. enterica serovar Kentucky]
KGKQLNGADGSADLAKYIQAGATYYFNKNMNVWVDYRFNLLDNAGLSFYFHKFLTGQVVTLNAFKRFYLSLFVTYVTLENCYTT